ncbi:gamma-glutamylcyclotransferase [Akkermansiaceae bacterium]|nr:gamma-glutamylcyclotransferase [Akkermansiaceae bacterium]MDB4266305.1 gamma-glutamylcyclotransferase [bacterium]MDA7876667.1 gamma-glutamylcyclotransferase [Akkermansiaceae bacterium]MDA7932106.1 gamma-glutamylcyclotransferase [Akkermansiaceae bacterium]MDB0055485.1 gamma-glutamylcyclotransferase [Akkermansiaceae bacterium]
MPDLIFVYGALRKGASNDWRMKKARWLGPSEVEGTLLKIDWYPGLVLGSGGLVRGEVYEISAELLSELDAFEGIGLEDDRNGEYHRVRKEVSLDDTPTEVWIYEWLKGIEDYEVVASGDWLASS